MRSGGLRRLASDAALAAGTLCVAIGSCLPVVAAYAGDGYGWTSEGLRVSGTLEVATVASSAVGGAAAWPARSFLVSVFASLGFLVGGRCRAALGASAAAGLSAGWLHVALPKADRVAMPWLALATGVLLFAASAWLRGPARGGASPAAG
jgi:hypothetical protein